MVLLVVPASMGAAHDELVDAVDEYGQPSCVPSWKRLDGGFEIAANLVDPSIPEAAVARFVEDGLKLGP